MYWRPLNLQSSSLLTYWKKIRICILISWAFILLDSSAQENGEHGRPMASLAEMNLHFLTIFYYLPVAAQKLWNLHRGSWLLLERCRNMLKNLKYVSSVANLSDILFLLPWTCLSIGILWQDFMALLAYNEPEKSPMFHLLSLEYRQQVSDSLNRAILGVF